jgi:hypothetical protein
MTLYSTVIRKCGSSSLKISVQEAGLGELQYEGPLMGLMAFKEEMSLNGEEVRSILKNLSLRSSKL